MPNRADGNYGRGARPRKSDGARENATDADHLTLPRAATGYTASTTPPRAAKISSIMLVTTQQWFGMTLNVSPTFGFLAHFDRSRMPCSSEKPVTSASGYSTTRPKPFA